MGSNFIPSEKEVVMDDELALVTPGTYSLVYVSHEFVLF